MKKRPSLRDIAAVVGVHFSTVGLALKDSPKVLPETRRKIKEVADQMGYRQDAMLSALATYRHSANRQFQGVIAYLLTFPIEELEKSSPREYSCYLSARAHAEEFGFRLDPINVNLPKMSPSRLSDILKARGIKALVLAPLGPELGPFAELDWSSFSVVAIGYSIPNLRPHRTAPHQAMSMVLHLEKLRELGYKRIGMIMSHEVNARTNGHFLGAYFAEQRLHTKPSHVDALVEPLEGIQPDSVDSWIKNERPDCVIVPSPEIFKMIEDLGWDIPGQIGVSCLSRVNDDDRIAGIDEKFSSLGGAAVDLLLSLIVGNETGLPKYPRYSLVEGVWVWKPTLKPMDG